MPSIPKTLKMFFCRVTVPTTDLSSYDLSVQTKFYNHPFEEFFYVHEVGHKTEKPHFHLLIICKTTKIEITKWIRTNFNVTGNKQFSVVDKYAPDSILESLTYMHKGGLNQIYGKNEISIETLEQLKNNYKNILKDKKTNIDKKFEYYYDLILEQLETKFNKYNFNGYKEYLEQLEHTQLYKIIYDILLRNAISRRTLFRKNIIAEHAFVYCCHFADNKQLSIILDEVKDRECDKVFKILD